MIHSQKPSGTSTYMSLTLAYAVLPELLRPHILKRTEIKLVYVENLIMSNDSLHLKTSRHFRVHKFYFSVYGNPILLPCILKSATDKLMYMENGHCLAEFLKRE